MPPEQELKDREKAWSGAIQSGSSTAGFLDARYTNTEAEGNLWTKTADIANLAGAPPRYVVKFLTIPADDQMEVHVYDDKFAVVTGQDECHATFNGMAHCGTYRWTDTWVKGEDGVWRCVASHSSRSK